jgi:hypothetical protein
MLANIYITLLSYLYFYFAILPNNEFVYICYNVICYNFHDRL